MIDPVIGGLLGAIAGASIGYLLITLTSQRRRRLNGPDRQAPTSSPDPQASQGAGYLAAYAGAVVSASTFTTPEGPGVTLERVDSDQPILAHRAAHLHIGRGGLKFRSLNINDSFGVDATATCRAGDIYGGYSSYGTFTEHKKPHGLVPAPGCQCGWYAVPADVDAWHGTYTVDLLVELSGTVIEHEQGYRAEHQRVLECRLPRCPYCRQPTEVVLFADGSVEGMGCLRHFGDYPDQVTRTEYHGSTARQKIHHVLVVSRADVEAACPVPVVDDD